MFNDCERKIGSACAISVDGILQTCTVVSHLLTEQCVVPVRCADIYDRITRSRIARSRRDTNITLLMFRATLLKSARYADWLRYAACLTRWSFRRIRALFPNGWTRRYNVITFPKSNTSDNSGYRQTGNRLLAIILALVLYLCCIYFHCDKHTYAATWKLNEGSNSVTIKQWNQVITYHKDCSMSLPHIP